MISSSVSFFDPVYSKVCYKDDIVLGLVDVINALPEKALKKDLIVKICQPFANQILENSKLIPNQEIEEVDTKAQRLSLSKVCKNLDKLTLIVKNLTPAEDDAEDHDIVSVLKDMWPLIESFLVRFYVSYHSSRTCLRSSRLSAGSSSKSCAASSTSSASSSKPTSKS
jgi:hypothetical protein